MINKLIIKTTKPEGPLVADGVSHLLGNDNIVHCIPIIIFPLHHPLEIPWEFYNRERKGNIIFKWFVWFFMNDVTTEEWIEWKHAELSERQVCHRINYTDRTVEYIYHDG